MRLSGLLISAAMLAAGSAYAAPTTYTSGATTMGVDDTGGLGRGTDGAFLGISREGVGDAITPGCLCEGWGTSGDANANWVYGLAANFASSSQSGNVVTTTTTYGTTVTHTYNSVAGTDLFSIDITITNNSGATIASNRYARTLDWDVPPGHFSDDFTTVFGGPAGIGGKLIHTSFDPFAEPDPRVFRDNFCGVDPNTNATDVPGDCGGYFIFDFGSLADGESLTFTTVIGSAASVRELLAQFGALNIEAYHYTYDNDGPAVFGYGFVGVGLPPIETPAPATLALFGIGALGLGFARRR